MEVNLKRVCRICLKEKVDMHSIFGVIINDNCRTDGSDIFFVHKMVMTVSSMQITADDIFPKQICNLCLESAESAYKFQQKCNKSQALFDTYQTKFSTRDTEKMMFLIVEDSNEKRTETNQESSKSEDSTEKKTELDGFNEAEILEDLKEIEVNDKILKQNLNVDEVKLSSGCARKELGDEKIVYACKLCKRKYKYESSLEVHMASHEKSNETDYSCNVCEKNFTDVTHLYRHMRVHSDERPFKCKLCEKCYKHAASLEAHHRIHSGARPYLCSICGKGFRQAPDLKYHMRVHTKEKPYMCSVCGKTMSMQSHLVLHMRTHTGERPYSCDQCGKTFPSINRLKRHTITHTDLRPYGCTSCEKSFNRASTLRTHEKTHRGVQVYACKICGKHFSQAHTLRTHVKLHADVDNYKTVNKE